MLDAIDEENEFQAIVVCTPNPCFCVIWVVYYALLDGGWLKPKFLSQIPWELWKFWPPKFGIVLSYGPPNHGGGIWVNQIFSTNHVGT